MPDSFLLAGPTALDKPAIVAGLGARLQLADGRTVIDGGNVAAALGHGHPEIVEAVRRAAAAPAVGDSHRWDEREDAARELIETVFGGESWVGAVRFFLSGAEANDVALSLCQALTGRRILATREDGYHGGVGIARDVTVADYWHGGLEDAGGAATPAVCATPVTRLPGPGGARIGDSRGEPDPATFGDALEDTAAVILDYSQGGAYHSASYQDAVAAAAREAGALWIADEVVTAFGRTGHWLALQGGRSRPDVVTLGKALGAGVLPVAAVVVSKELAERLEDRTWRNHSTYRGYPLAMSVVPAVLSVIRRDGLVERAAARDALMFERLGEIAARHSSVRRIDGRALHWTIEVEAPAQPELVAAAALAAGALIGTGGEGELFLAPPLTIEDSELNLLLEALDIGLEGTDEQLTGEPRSA